MTVTVSCKNYSLIDDCEDFNTWDGGGGNPDDVTAFYKEGSQCVGFELWASGNLDIYITGSWNLDGVKHLRCWMMTTVLNELNTDALGGIQFYVSDGSNTGYYYVSGKTSYPGGWYPLVCDLSRTVDSGTKPTMSSITTIGLRFNLTASAKKVQSLWIDHLYVGDGLIDYGDDSGGPYDLDNILTADQDPSNGWGLLRKIGGIFYTTGNFTIGDNLGTNSCDFQPIGDILVFEQRRVGTSINVNSALYEIKFVGNGTGTTSIKIGDKVGTSGISGCTIKSIDPDRPFKITATDTNVETLGLYGSTFDTHGLVDLMVNSITREILNCTFTDGQAQIQPNTMKMEACNFISAGASVDGCVLIESVSHGLKNCSFINNPKAIEFESALSVTFDGLEFLGNTLDINNTSGGTVTINVLNTVNPPSTYSGDTDITVSASHKLTGMKQYSEVTYIETGTENVLFHVEDVDGTGETEYAYNATVEKTVDIQIHHLDYVPILVPNVTLTAVGGSIPITQAKDRTYHNP